MVIDEEKVLRRAKILGHNWLYMNKTSAGNSNQIYCKDSIVKSLDEEMFIMKSSTENFDFPNIT